MKYIITEEQYITIKESTIPTSIRRRANSSILDRYITNGIINYPTLCDDFDDAYQYVDNVIDFAVDELLYEIDDDIEDKEYYSDALDYLRGVFRELYEENLISDYEFTCGEY